MAQNDRSAQTATIFIVHSHSDSHSHSHSHSAVEEVGSCTSLVAIVEADSLGLRHVVHKVRIGVNVYYVSKTPTGADQSRFSVNPTSERRERERDTDRELKPCGDRHCAFNSFGPIGLVYPATGLTWLRS